MAANTCGATLAAQSVCTLSVQSNGTGITQAYTEQSFSGVLTIRDDAAAGPQTVNLSSTNVETISVPSIPATAVGSSTSITVSVTGTEHYDQATLNATVTGTNASDFSPSPLGCTGSGGPPTWQLCSFPLTFAPTGNGLRTARVAAGTGYVLLSATGTGGTGTSFTAPSTLTVPAIMNTTTNVASGTASLLITNTGSTTLRFAGFPIFSSNAQAFTTSNGCATIAASSTCSLAITYAPHTAVPTRDTGTLQLKDTNSGTTISVSITGFAQYAVPTAIPTSLNFGTVYVGSTSAAQTVSIGDPNGNPLGYPLTLSIPNSAGFSVSPTSCPASTTSLCTVSVTFTPASASGNVSAYLYAAYNGNSLGVTSLSANAAGTPSATLSTSAISFGSRAVGTTSIPVSGAVNNTGTAGLTVSSISIPAAVNGNFTQTTTCSGTVAPGSSCTISVTFAPSTAGSQSAVLNVLTNASTIPATVSLTGTAN